MVDSWTVKLENKDNRIIKLMGSSKNRYISFYPSLVNNKK
jgi:hypothetical protein